MWEECARQRRIGVSLLSVHTTGSFNSTAIACALSVPQSHSEHLKSFFFLLPARTIPMLDALTLDLSHP